MCFSELVRIMVDADLELAGLPASRDGRRILQEHFKGWHHWDDQVISMEGLTRDYKIMA